MPGMDNFSQMAEIPMPGLVVWGEAEVGNCRFFGSRLEGDSSGNMVVRSYII